MKILALRLSEVGPFRTGVALEGFSGGFDVLTGPNETGKSTLFAALGTLLSERHTSTSQKIAALRPDTGGAPMIEADLEFDGRVLRLRKRFLAQRMASLVEIRSGQIWHGSDAESAIEKLLGGETGRALRGLLWVAQGSSFALPEKPDSALAEGLARLIEKEAAEASGAGHLRQLSIAIAKRREEFVTAAQGKAKAGGALDIARRRRDDLAQRLAMARAKADTAEARLQRRNVLTEQLQSVTAADARRSLEDAAAAARVAVAEADKAREMVALAAERVQSRQLAFAQAEKRFTDLERAIAAADRLEHAIIACAASLDDHRTRHDRTAERAQEASGRLDDIEAELRAARTAQQAAQAARERAAALAEAAEADQRLAAARAAEHEASRLQAIIAANGATEEAVDRASRLDAQLRALERRIALEAPRFRVTYLPDAKGRLRIAGEAVEGGIHLTIDRPIELAIDGIGTVVVEPGGGAAQAAAGERKQVGDELASILEAIEAASLDEAQQLLSKRRAAIAALNEARARLAGVAPNGIDPLARLRDTALERAAMFPSDDAREIHDLAAIAQRIQDLEQKVEQDRRCAVAVDTELKALSTSIARLEQQLSADTRQHDTLSAGLPESTARTAALDETRHARDGANAALGAAIRERSAWAEVAPQDEAYEALVARAKRATAALDHLETHRAQLERDIAELEGGMRRDNEDGVGAEVDSLEQELQAAEARLADIEADVAALSLLAGRLEQISATHRDRMLRPLIDRLAPMLGRLFPSARLSMDGPLLAVRLERQEGGDPISRISGGSREQIATMVRIAYAQLLAKRGASLPLVLDDALAYSDDVRLEAMVELLAEAAQQHQVILLSCHQLAVEPLAMVRGARRLMLGKWDEAETELQQAAGKGKRSTIRGSNAARLSGA